MWQESFEGLLHPARMQGGRALPGHPQVLPTAPLPQAHFCAEPCHQVSLLVFCILAEDKEVCRGYWLLWTGVREIPLWVKNFQCSQELGAWHLAAAHPIQIKKVEEIAASRCCHWKLSSSTTPGSSSCCPTGFFIASTSHTSPPTGLTPSFRCKAFLSPK